MQRPTLADAQRVAARYGVTGAVELVAGGHINESFRVEVQGGSLLLQWLNPAVFPDPDAVQDNVEAVLCHLEAKDPDAGWPGPARTLDGALRTQDATGLWRALRWLPDRVQLERPGDRHEARCGAGGFARFVSALADFDPQGLHPVLPGFHDLTARLEAFDRALVQASPTRCGEARAAVESVLELREQHAQGSEPSPYSRVIHGDTKFTNLLFAADRSTALAVDYDTVMPGRLAWDFGDMLRSAASTGAEDDPAGGRVRDAILEAAALGYLDGLEGHLSTAERSALPSAPAHMAFMLGVRFLTDFLLGDHYFRIRRPGQNLDRARHQFALAQALAQRADVIARLLD